MMAMPYKKDSALCSPTSALEKIRMLSRLGEEVGTEEFSLTDSDKFIVERHWGHMQHACTLASDKHPTNSLRGTRDGYNERPKENCRFYY
jgi:hypothetical protein